MATIEYDPADEHDAFKLLTEVSERRSRTPFGFLYHSFARAMAIFDMAPGRFPSQQPDPERTRPTAQEALAALTVLRSTAAWIRQAEPALIEAAREAGATWEEIAPCLGVADRRAAQTRGKRGRRHRAADTTP